MNELETLKTIEKSALAILMLLVEARENDGKSVDKNKKVEVLLAKAGFKAPEITKIVNKNLAAVQKAIQRGRK